MRPVHPGACGNTGPLPCLRQVEHSCVMDSPFPIGADRAAAAIPVSVASEVGMNITHRLRLRLAAPRAPALHGSGTVDELRAARAANHPATKYHLVRVLPNLGHRRHRRSLPCHGESIRRRRRMSRTIFNGPWPPPEAATSIGGIRSPAGLERAAQPLRMPLPGRTSVRPSRPQPRPATTGCHTRRPTRTMHTDRAARQSRPTLHQQLFPFPDTPHGKLSVPLLLRPFNALDKPEISAYNPLGAGGRIPTLAALQAAS